MNQTKEGGIMFNYEYFKNGYKKIVKVEPMQSLWESMKKMKMASTNFAVICDKNSVMGFFTNRRYINLLNSNCSLSPGMSVRDLSLNSIYYARPDQDLNSTIKFMKNNGIKSIPIIDEDEFLGILDWNDAVDILIDEREHMIDMLEQYITGSPFHNLTKKNLGIDKVTTLTQLSTQILSLNEFQRLFEKQNNCI